MSGLRRKRTYDKEFKLEAVRLVLEEGRSAASVEREPTLMSYAVTCQTSKSSVVCGITNTLLGFQIFPIDLEIEFVLLCARLNHYKYPNLGNVLLHTLDRYYGRP
jgi:hypothetical protein